MKLSGIKLVKLVRLRIGQLYRLGKNQANVNRSELGGATRNDIVRGIFILQQGDIVHDLTQCPKQYNKSSGETYVHIYTWSPLAATLYALQARNNRSPRVDCFGEKLLKAHYGAAYVRELLVAGDGFYLSDGMSQRACATDHAAVPHRMHATWIRPVHASGTRFMNVRSKWVDRKSSWKCCHPWIGKKQVGRPGEM